MYIYIYNKYFNCTMLITYLLHSEPFIVFCFVFFVFYIGLGLLVYFVTTHSMYSIFLPFTTVLMFQRARVALCASLYLSSITRKGKKLVEKKITVSRSRNVDHKEGKMTRPCVNCAFAFAELLQITIIITHLLWLNTCG